MINAMQPSHLFPTRNRGVVTCCDANYFAGLIAMYDSVQLSCPCPVVAFDLGMTEAQHAFAKSRERLHIMNLPEDPRIQRVRHATQNDAPLRKQGKRIWPLWICPILIDLAPFDDVYWLDCDLLVLRDFDVMLAALDDGPVFTPENKAPEVTANDLRLYDHAPIDRTFDPKVPLINAGVSGWRKSRDHDVLDAYLLLVDRATSDARLRALVAWHDQGCLIWAIQKTGQEHRVRPDFSWNCSVEHTAIFEDMPDPGSKELTIIRERVPRIAVVHWNGQLSPWVGRSLEMLPPNEPCPSQTLP